MKRMIVLALFSSFFTLGADCGQKGSKTTVVQPNFGCRARSGYGVPGTNYELGVGGVEYYSMDSSSKSSAVREARAEYITNNPDIKESKVRVNCWSCNTNGLDSRAKEVCEPKTVRASGSGSGCSISSVGK